MIAFTIVLLLLPLPLSVLGAVDNDILLNARRQASHRNRSSPDILEKRQQFGGRATFYDVGLGACGDVNVNSDYIVALNLPQWGANTYPGENCNRPITITYGGKTLNAIIKDLCPSCSWGSLDLSRGLFNAFASEDLGVFQMTWDWADGSPPTPVPPTPSAPAIAPAPEPSASSAAAWTPPPQSSWAPPPPPSSTYSPSAELSWSSPASSISTQAVSSSSLSTSPPDLSSNSSNTASIPSSSKVTLQPSTPLKPPASSSAASTIPSTGTPSPSVDILEGAGNLILMNVVVTNLGNMVVIGAQGAQS